MKNFIFLAVFTLASISSADSQLKCEAEVRNGNNVRFYNFEFSLDEDNSRGEYNLTTFESRPLKHLIPYFSEGTLNISKSELLSANYSLVTLEGILIGELVINHYVGTFTLELKGEAPVLLECRS